MNCDVGDATEVLENEQNMNVNVLNNMGGSPGDLRGAMGTVQFWSFWSKITCFILLNKFNLNLIIYDSLNFLISITAVQPFIRSYVNFCAI